jgi:hypothetical protein
MERKFSFLFFLLEEIEDRFSILGTHIAEASLWNEDGLVDEYGWRNGNTDS